MKNARGVTLIELLIVLMLVVAVTGLAAVGFVHFFRQNDPKAYVKDMSGYVRYLQFKAIEDGKTHKLTAREGEGGLQVFVQEKGNQFVAVRDSLAKKFETKGPFEIRMESGREIYFFPDGTVTKNQILVLEEDHKIASLSVNNRLGAMKVEFYV